MVSLLHYISFCTGNFSKPYSHLSDSYDDCYLNCFISDIHLVDNKDSSIGAASASNKPHHLLNKNLFYLSNKHSLFVDYTSIYANPVTNILFIRSDNIEHYSNNKDYKIVSEVGSDDNAGTLLIKEDIEFYIVKCYSTQYLPIRKLEAISFNNSLFVFEAKILRSVSPYILTWSSMEDYFYCPTSSNQIDVANFCFPSGIKLAHKPGRLEQFEINITTEENASLFGLVTLYDEELSNEELANLKPQFNSNIKYFTKKAICVISKFPYYTQMKKIGLLLYKHRSNSEEIENLCSQLILKLKMPENSRQDQEICYSVFDDTSELNLDFQPFSYFSYSDEIYADILTCLSILSPENLLDVTQAIMLEKKILIKGSYQSIFKKIISGLLALIFPFAWHHTVCFLIPCSHHIMLEAPVPYIAGVLNEDFENLMMKQWKDSNQSEKRTPNTDEVYISGFGSDEVMIVNLDKDEVVSINFHLENLDIDFRSQLLKAVSKIITPEIQNQLTNWKEDLNLFKDAIKLENPISISKEEKMLVNSVFTAYSSSFLSMTDIPKQIKSAKYDTVKVATSNQIKISDKFANSKSKFLPKFKDTNNFGSLSVLLQTHTKSNLSRLVEFVKNDFKLEKPILDCDKKEKYIAPSIFIQKCVVPTDNESFIIEKEDDLKSNFSKSILTDFNKSMLASEHPQDSNLDQLSTYNLNCELNLRENLFYVCSKDWCFLNTESPKLYAKYFYYSVFELWLHLTSEFLSFQYQLGYSSLNLQAEELGDINNSVLELILKTLTFLSSKKNLKPTLSSLLKILSACKKNKIYSQKIVEKVKKSAKLKDLCYDDTNFLINLIPKTEVIKVTNLINNFFITEASSSILYFSPCFSCLQKSNVINKKTLIDLAKGWYKSEDNLCYCSKCKDFFSPRVFTYDSATDKLIEIYYLINPICLLKLCNSFNSEDNFDVKEGSFPLYFTMLQRKEIFVNYRFFSEMIGLPDLLSLLPLLINSKVDQLKSQISSMKLRFEHTSVSNEKEYLLSKSHTNSYELSKKLSPQIKWKAIELISLRKACKEKLVDSSAIKEELEKKSTRKEIENVIKKLF